VVGLFSANEAESSMELSMEPPRNAELAACELALDRDPVLATFYFHFQPTVSLKLAADSR